MGKASTYKRLGDTFTAIGLEAQAARLPVGKGRRAIEERAAEMRSGRADKPSFFEDLVGDLRARAGSPSGG